MTSIVAALSAVFVAEFGDKSQLVTAGFALRRSRGIVVLAVAVAAAAVQAVSVAVGGAVAGLLPRTIVTAVAAAAFLVVAVWTLLDADEEDDERSRAAPETPTSAGDRSSTDTDAGSGPAERRVRTITATRHGTLRAIGVIAATFAVGEIGDKTMLATFALAARNDPLGTWIGATLGMVAANVVAVEVGRRVGDRVDRTTIRRAAAALFAAAGLALVATLLV